MILSMSSGRSKAFRMPVDDLGAGLTIEITGPCEAATAPHDWHVGSGGMMLCQTLGTVT